MKRNLFVIAAIMVAFIVALSAIGTVRTEASGRMLVPMPTPVKHRKSTKPTAPVNKPRVEGDPDQPIVVGNATPGSAAQPNSAASAPSATTPLRPPGYIGGGEDGLALAHT